MGHLLKRHGLKLSIANLLGYLFVNFVGAIVLMILFIIFLMLGILSALNSNFEFQFEELSIFQIILFAIGYFLFILVSVAISFFQFGGVYGSALDAVYNDYSSISSYFNNMFRYGWKMILLHLCIGIMFIPLFIFLIIIASLLAFVSEVLGILVSFVFWIPFIIPLLFAPLLVIKDGVGIWRSIGLSFKLFRLKPGKTLSTFGLMILGSLSFIIPMLLSLLFSMPTYLGGEDAFAITMAIISLLIGLFASFIGMPFALTASSLILSQRYKDVFRPLVFPETGQVDVEPNFSFKDNPPYQ